MELGGGAGAITAFSSVFVSTIKIAEKVFEIRAVDEQAKAVLQTVNQVSGQLESARILRRQKSTLFTTFEKQMFDETFRRTDEAIKQVASLAERARADMEVTGGKVRVNTRILFVLRDSPNIHVSLTRLGIASQSLTAAIMTLSCRDPRPIFSSGYNTPPSNPGEMRSPPTYEESQFLAEGRQRNMRRKQSAMSLGSTRDSTYDRTRSMSSLHSHQEEGVSELAEYRTGVPQINVADRIEEDDDIDLLESHFIPPPLRARRSRNHNGRLSLPTDRLLTQQQPPLTASELSAQKSPTVRRDSGIAGVQSKDVHVQTYQELIGPLSAPLPGRRNRSAFRILQHAQQQESNVVNANATPSPTMPTLGHV